MCEGFSRETLHNSSPALPYSIPPHKAQAHRGARYPQRFLFCIHRSRIVAYRIGPYVKVTVRGCEAFCAQTLHWIYLYVNGIKSL